MGRRRPGELENDVIEALGAGEWMSEAEGAAQLPDPLAHTTVMTALVRLADKGLVSRERRGRAYAYRLIAPVDSLPALRAALRMRRTLDTRDDRADVLVNFVASLEPEDEALLMRILAGDKDIDEHGR